MATLTTSGLDRAVIGEAHYSGDGTFNPKAVVTLKKSFIEMGLLKEAPPDDVMFTTQFVPVK